jgi:hypothetical protein
MQPDDQFDMAGANLADLKERLDELRRSLYRERSRLKRRLDDVRRLSELEVRIQNTELTPSERKALEDACGAVRRAVDRSRLVDGPDDELAQRLSQTERAVASFERHLMERRTQETVTHVAGVGDVSRDRERAQRARRQKILTTLTACARQLDALTIGAGIAAAPATEADESDLSDEALRARWIGLTAQTESVSHKLREARYRSRVRLASLESELAYWERLRHSEQGVDFEALSQHLSAELHRFIGLLDAHLASRMDEALQYMNETAISRFNETHSEAEADPAFEKITFRNGDLQLLSDLARCLIEPHLQAQSLLLPARSAMALASFRSSADPSRVFGAPLSQLATRPHLQVPAISPPIVSSLAHRITQLKGVPPLAPRVEAHPLRRLRRGNALGAAGALLARAGRFLPKLLQPLAILSLLGYSALKLVKAELSQMMGSSAAIVLAILVMMTYRSWTKETRLSELEMLKKGKAMLYDRISKQLDDLRQAWKRELSEHCENSIKQIQIEFKQAVTTVRGDEARGQREYSRVESELRERTTEQRRLLDAYLQTQRITNENLRAVAVAIETELALGGEERARGTAT